MAGEYEMIDSGICPGCYEKMESLPLWFDMFCSRCNIRYRYVDTGPGYYVTCTIDDKQLQYLREMEDD